MLRQIWQAVVNGIRSSITGIRNILHRRAPEAAIDFDDPVGGAVRDAELLIAFAAQSYRRIEPKKVARLIETAGAISAAKEAGQAISHEQRAAFWGAYDELAADMAPLSAYSIRSSMRLNKKGFTGSFLTPTAGYAAMALMVFFLCLVVQCFWCAGKDLSERAEKLEAQKLEIQQKMTRNDIDLRRSRARLADVQEQICQIDSLQCDDTQAKRKTGKPNELARLAELGVEAKWVRSEVQASELQESELNTESTRLNDTSRPFYNLLLAWHKRANDVCSYHYLSLLCPLGQKAVIDQSIENLKTEIRSHEKKMREFPAISKEVAEGNHDGYRYRMLREKIRRDHTLQSLKLQLNKSEVDQFGRTLLEVRIIVGNISTYVIAMLMGLLGALTFILRTMSQQLREHTYVPTSVSISIIRICLGAIAGVFGSLLVPGAEASLKSVPPLFIPFVFGYGIEILFSLLDKTVNSFTHPDGGAGNGNGRK